LNRRPYREPRPDLSLTYHHVLFYLIDDSSSDTRTFEELCRAHIQAFARGAEKYAADTKLSQRVGQWQERLGPLLEKEEQRPVFDIHAYGQVVIETMEKEIRRMHPDIQKIVDAPIKVVDFREVTRNSSTFEVCRIFLASLSLSNSGNVKLNGNRADGTSMFLELLSSEIEHPMETYLAPSAAEEIAS
jgi:condensin-2 complex subunit H2